MQDEQVPEGRASFHRRLGTFVIVTVRMFRGHMSRLVIT